MKRPFAYPLLTLLLLFGCKEEEPGWWCRDADQAKRHHNGEQSCWRAKSHCSGMCKHQEVARCYSAGSGRYCYANEEQCRRAQEANPSASSKCAAAWK